MSILQPDHHMDQALQVALESMQEIVNQERDVEQYAAKTLATLRVNHFIPWAESVPLCGRE